MQLNENDQMIADMAQAFADEHIAPKAGVWDKQCHMPTDVLKQSAELGMAGIYCKEDIGGSGMGRRQAALIFEALASGCPTISAFLSVHNMVAWMIDKYGSEDTRMNFGKKLCAMDIIGAICLTEPGSGSDAAALKTSAEISGDEIILNGSKQFISGAGLADLYLVMVRTGDNSPADSPADRTDGISAVLVEKNSPGLSFGKAEEKMGWNAQPTGQVIFENCRIPKNNLLGTEGKGFRYALSGLTGGRVNIAACSVGGARRAVEIATEYAATRKAFGKTLKEFQNTQFKLAELQTSLLACRLMLLEAADALDAEAPNYVETCAMAKLFCTDNGFDITNQALQILGGYGYLSDYGIEKILRDLRVHQILEGTNEIMRLIIARSLWQSNE